MLSDECVNHSKKKWAILGVKFLKTKEKFIVELLRTFKVNVLIYN